MTGTADQPRTGYGRLCHGGHLVADGNAYHNPSGKWECRQCRRLRDGSQSMEEIYWQKRGARTPWSGHQPCPLCGSTDWTLPVNGRLDAVGWRCVWPCHLYFTVERAS